jgi:hypothetical protein
MLLCIGRQSLSSRVAIFGPELFKLLPVDPDSLCVNPSEGANFVEGDSFFAGARFAKGKTASRDSVACPYTLMYNAFEFDNSMG